MPANLSMQPGTRDILAFTLLLLAGSPAVAEPVRYELFPEPDVRQTATNRTASAYVVDKKGNQFWICTARYDFRDLTDNNGDCVKLPLDIGRPTLTESYDAQAVTGTTSVGARLQPAATSRRCASPRESDHSSPPDCRSDLLVASRHPDLTTVKAIMLRSCIGTVHPR